MAKKLTPSEQRFVEEYLIDLNATQAAIRAGYAKSGAAVQGHRLLRNDKIAAAIQQAKQERTERTNITADNVLRELARVGFSDIQSIARITDEGVAVRVSDDWTEDDSRCVQSISEKIDDGRRLIAVKLWDKLKALEMLAKHLGVYDDKPDVNVNVSWAEMLTEVQAAKAKRKD